MVGTRKHWYPKEKNALHFEKEIICPGSTFGVVLKIQSMKKAFPFFLILIFHTACSQVLTDDFSDGNFSQNPAWHGDSSDFIINAANQLQLQGTLGPSFLSVASPDSSLRNKEWRFYIRENFSPSGYNNGRVYLASSQSNLTDSLNGYFLQFGESGSNDAVELFCQSGYATISVCRGTNGEIASSFSLTIKVTRDSLGKWNLYVDPLGGANYVLECSGTDTTYKKTSFFGVQASYTISDASKFYWTDFYVGPIYVNHTLPVVSSLQVVSGNGLDVEFNEAVDSLSATLLSNYRADKNLGNPVSANRDSLIQSLVHLVFGSPIASSITYTLHVKQVKNLIGDSMKASDNAFWIYVPKAYDVVINEIMANPNPAQNLPPYEYVELYNRTAFPIDLDNWTINEGKKSHPITGVVILPDSFVVLCSINASLAFDPALPVFGVVGFSAVNNTSAELTLKNEQEAVISDVTYSDAWYGDENKKKGGWSLEQIDASNPCGAANNWRASRNPNGGSPGRRNSVQAPNPDLTAPQVLRVAVLSEDTIQLFFDKSVDSTSMQDPSIYSIDRNIRIASLHPVGNDFKSIVLCLLNAISPAEIYTITVTGKISDCSGNIIGTDNSAHFAIPLEPDESDLVLNEVLSDPKTNGVKYVEIYNRSSKVIDLKHLNLSSEDSLSGALTDTKTISTGGFLVFPGEYLLLSTNQDAVKKQYNTLNPKAFVDLPAMPRMNIDAGTIVLVTTSGKVIDRLVYSSAWQFPLLASTKGVSLERVDYNRMTQDAGNWHSAADAVGYGTPAYRNSQFLNADSGSGFSLSDEIFSPDEDGYKDVLGIAYHLDGPDFVGTVSIFDARGRKIRTLITNALLGTEGSFNWDGIGDNREKAPVGIYIVFFEAFDSKGNIRTFKKACVLAAKL